VERGEGGINIVRAHLHSTSFQARFGTSFKRATMGSSEKAPSSSTPSGLSRGGTAKSMKAASASSSSTPKKEGDGAGEEKAERPQFQASFKRLLKASRQTSTENKEDAEDNSPTHQQQSPTAEASPGKKRAPMTAESILAHKSVVEKVAERDRKMEKLHEECQRELQKVRAAYEGKVAKMKKSS